MPNCVFPGIGNNHVGIITKVDGETLTVQGGNLDAITNIFKKPPQIGKHLQCH